MAQIVGPIAPYNNVPIQPQYYQPSQFVITDLSYGTTTTVTMDDSTNDVSPNYVIGQLVRLLLPTKYGASQLNNKIGYVLSLPTASSVQVGINSIGTDPFIASPVFLVNENHTPPQIIAVGDINTGALNANGRSNTGTFIPGSFIDISPL